MPKNTAKYVSAVSKARELSVYADFPHQEQLYSTLNKCGFYWNSDLKIWEELNQDADPPTELIRVRVWTDARFVEQAAVDLISSLDAQGLRLVEKSLPFPCRPPKQLESRIYLTFIKEPDKPSAAPPGALVLGGSNS
jgi:hypothetical protein